jgi:hypothetical protein
LKGTYRRTWYDNNMRLHLAAGILGKLHDAGITTMLLKGAALLVRYYRDYGLRPMNDLDVLVPRDRAPEAVDVMKELGWTPLREAVGISEDAALARGHAYPFRNAAGQEIDLHWHVFYQRVAPMADTDLWASALPLTVHGVPTHTLGPADQLLHVCVHGTQMAWWMEERAPNLRWIADAMMILRVTSGEMDWDRVVSQAQRSHFLLPLREALSYLRDMLEAPIPADVMSRIRRAPVSLGERITDRARSRPVKHWGPWVALGVRYLEYVSTHPGDVGFLRRLAGLAAFFQERWGQLPSWHLPFVAVGRGLRRVCWSIEGMGSAVFDRHRAGALPRRVCSRRR